MTLTLLTDIFILSIGAAILDFSLARYVRLQESVYRVTLIVVWFLFVIRYYYGPDIYNYVPVYDNLHPWYWYLQHPDHYEFEHGFILFCAVLKGLGLSYYWMTAIVTTFYFGIIALYFSRIRRHKTIALMILVLFDYTLIFATHRQCLSVTFFVLMVMLMDKKELVWALICAWLAVSMHKAGIFIISLTWLYYLVHNHRLERVFFLSIFALLCVMLVLPMTKISSSFIMSLPLPESFVASLKEHLLLGRQVQLLWVVYAMLVVSLEYYFQHRYEVGHATEVVVVLGLVFIALAYQYFYLLTRLRSYFLPFLIVYLFGLVQETEDNRLLAARGSVLLKDLCVIFLFGYFGIRTLHFEQGARNLNERAYTPRGETIYTTCTVFDLLHRPAKDVQWERLLIAKYYWWYDYMVGEQNKLK